MKLSQDGFAVSQKLWVSRWFLNTLSLYCYTVNTQHPITHHTDQLPCVMAFNRSKRGAFSSSARISTFLTTISQLNVEIIHEPGKMKKCQFSRIIFAGRFEVSRQNLTNFFLFFTIHLKGHLFCFIFKDWLSVSVIFILINLTVSLNYFVVMYIFFKWDTFCYLQYDKGQFSADEF